MSNSMITKKYEGIHSESIWSIQRRNERNYFGTMFSARREDKYPWIGESHASAADNKLKESHVYIWK